MNRQHPVPDPAAGGAAATRDAYRTYVLAALSVVCFMQNVDRVVIFMFLQPIKQEFMLTDTQVGLISGAAFAITQGLMAVPVARLADAGLHGADVSGDRRRRHLAE